MKTTAAVIRESRMLRPYANSRPLVLEEVELAPPGPGEVLVEMAAAGLCHSDLSVINGSRLWPMPMVLGHEAAGIVRELGPGVADLQEGDHVVFSYVPVCGQCRFCIAGRGSLCERGVRANRAGTLLSGELRFSLPDGTPLHHHLGVSGYARHTVASARSLVRIDPAIPLDRAVLFGCAVLTGVGAVVNTARVEPGSSVAVFGLGGVGLSAVMGARLAGANPVIAVDILPAKLESARQAGATHVVNAAAMEAVEAVRDLSNGGVDYAFESVGNAGVLATAYEATARGGTTVSIGLPHPEEMLSISAANIVGEEKTLKGSYMGSCVPSRDVPRFLALYQDGKLPVDLLHSATIPLSDLNAGFDRLDRGEAIRQVVRFD